MQRKYAVPIVGGVIALLLIMAGEAIAQQIQNSSFYKIKIDLMYIFSFLSGKI